MTSAELAIGRAVDRSRRLARALSDAEPWFVGPSLVAGLMTPRLLGAALVAAAVFWFVRWAAWGRLTVRTAGDGAIAILILLLPVTSWVTALPDVTRRQVLLLLAGIALYYVIVNSVRTAGRERALVLCLVGAGLLTSVVAPVTVNWVEAIKLTFIPATLYDRLPLLASIPVNPNVLAGGLVLALPVPLALLMFDASGMRPRERLASAAAVMGMAVILVLTKSRGGLLAAATAGFALCLLRWRRSWIIIVLAALPAALVFWRMDLGHVIEKLSATGSLDGWPVRLEIWSRGLYAVHDFPFTGIGMGTFQEVANGIYPFFLLGPNGDVPHAHNLFLQVAVDLGIPGLVAWLGLLFLAALGAWRLYRSGRRQGLGWETGLGAALLCSQLALVVHGMLDAAVWGAHSAMVVWALWGLCTAAYNLRFAPAAAGQAAWSPTSGSGR